MFGAGSLGRTWGCAFSIFYCTRTSVEATFIWRIRN